ncbi:DnaT-like ssDNA-binding protein, partial [Salmonella enterica]
MALVVEDGSIVAGADSYLSLEDARALAAKYGYALPADDTEAEAALRNGAMYVGLQEPAMCGRRVSATQSLSFPRTGISLYGFPVASNVIPDQVKLAQLIAGVEYGNGADVRASSDGRV